MPPPEFEVQSIDEDSLLFDKSGNAYRCFCSPDILTETREKLARSGSNLTDEEAARRVRAGEKLTIRLNVFNIFVLLRLCLTNRTAYFLTDHMRKTLSLEKTDPIRFLFPTYHLASVVDDYEMGIKHCIFTPLIVILRNGFHLCLFI